MELKLHVCNPSNYWRAGHVTARWAPICKEAGIEPERSVPQRLASSDGREDLKFQIDRIDPDDRSYDTLSFTLNGPVAPGKEDYSVSSTSVTLQYLEEATLRADHPRVTLKKEESDGQTSRVTLDNDVLKVRFDLVPSPEDKTGSWYSGSATSVLLHNKEMLDWGPDFYEHDPEKRCGQLDYVQLSRPAWESVPLSREYLFNREYSLLSASDGPVRAFIAIASPKLVYSHKDPLTQRTVDLPYYVIRVIGLYAGADHVTEELFIKSIAPQGTDPSAKIDFHFTAGYFSYLSIGPLSISHFENIPDWFAVSGGIAPYHGYGFATDVHAGRVANPHPGAPGNIRDDHCFSWQLLPCKIAKCIHLFTRFDLAETKEFLQVHQDEARRYFESRIGAAWYSQIYKPLRIGLPGKGVLYE